jgi:hypothetical protein
MDHLRNGTGSGGGAFGTSRDLSGAFCQILESMHSEGNIPNGGVLTRSGKFPHQDQGLFLGLFFMKIGFRHFVELHSGILPQLTGSASRSLRPGPRPLRTLSRFPGAYSGKFANTLNMGKVKPFDCERSVEGYIEHVTNMISEADPRTEATETWVSKGFRLVHRGESPRVSDYTGSDLSSGDTAGGVY